MTYDSIPLPPFPFTDVPEMAAKKVADFYFSTLYITDDIDQIKNFIYTLTHDYDQEDKIVFYSYLINQLFLLPGKNKEYGLSGRVITEREKESYKTILHHFYKQIKKEGILIPEDIFNPDDIIKAEGLLISITDALKQLKVSEPTKADGIDKVIKDVENTKDSFWQGKKAWLKTVAGTILLNIIKEKLEHIGPVIFTTLMAQGQKWLTELIVN